MLRSFEKLLGRNYEPLNRIEVSVSNLAANYNYLSSINENIKVAPVLKSNAYGHGLTLIANYLDKFEAPFLCVDSLYEAYELLKKNVTTPVLIVGYINPISLHTKKLPFSFAVYDYERIDALNKYQQNAKIHIFVDTGMHREGIQLEELAEFVKYIKSKTNLEIEGLMSHLGMSDHPENPMTRNQVNNFIKAQEIFSDLNIKPKWIHLGNSSALLNNEKYPGKLGNVVRIGLAFYGIDPEFKDRALKPVLSLITQVSQIKELNIGEKVGYDYTFSAVKKMKIAILPIGYFDGIDRRLSNKGFVKIKNKYCKIVGRVSMNITTVDVTHIQDLRVGDKAIMFSNIKKDKNSIENLAKASGAIQYELPVHLDSSIKRVVV